MSRGKYSEDEQNNILDQLDDVKKRLEIDSVVWTRQISGKLLFLRWLSTYKEQIKRGKGLANIELNTHQASLFAFSLEKNNTDNFLLFAQPNEYRWLKDIGIIAASLLSDGLLLRFASMNVCAVNLSSLTLKIPFSPLYQQVLDDARLTAKWLWLGEIVQTADMLQPGGEWEITNLCNEPIVLSKIEEVSHLKPNVQYKFL